MALTIDNLEIQIQSESKKATKGIESLATSLGKLKTAVGDSNGLASTLSKIADSLKDLSSVGKINLTRTVNQLKKFEELIPSLGNSSQLAQNLKDIAGGLTAFSSVPSVSITPIANGIKGLNEATAGFDNKRLADFSVQMRGIADGLAQLNTIEKGNIGSVLNQLKKIPDITKSLDPQTIDQFAVAMKRLEEILTPLASKMESVSKGFGALPTRMRSAIKASNQLQTSNSRLSKSYSSLATTLSFSLAKFWTLYYTAQRIVGVFADMFNTSNDYVETLNLFSVSMGEASDEARKYARTVQDIMGIDMAEWMNNQAVFMQTLTGFGVASDQAATMSKTLTQLGYDISSLWNADTDLVMSRLESAMTGQIKGMKNYGYNVSVAALQETALALGIEESVRQMTEAQKAQLRFITIMRNAEGTMGDMAKTINTPANAMRILSSQFTRLERAIGDIVSVLATKFIPYIQEAVIFATELAERLAVFVGFKIEDLPSNVTKNAGQFADDLDDANDAATELKKQLAGFDELNILKSDSAKKDLSYDLGIDMSQYDYDFLGGLTKDKESLFAPLLKPFETLDFSEAFERVKEFVTKIKEQFSELDFVSELKEAGDSLVSFLGALVNLCVQALAPLLEALNIPKILLSTIELLGTLFETLGNILRAVEPCITSFVEKGLVPIAEWVGETVVQTLQWLSDELEKIGDWFEKSAEPLKTFGELLGTLVGNVWAFIEPFASELWTNALDKISLVIDVALALADAIIYLANDILGDLNAGWDGFMKTIEPISTFISETLAGAFNEVLAPALEYLSGTAIPAIRDTLSNLWNEILVPIGGYVVSVLAPIFRIFGDVLSWLREHIIAPLTESVGGFLVKAFEGLVGVLNKTVIPIIGTFIKVNTWLLNNILVPVVDFLWDIFSPAFEEVFKCIGDVIKGAIKIFGGLIDFITGAFTLDWRKAWSGIVQIFTGMFGGLGSLIRSPLNATIGMLESLANKAVDAFNWIKRQLNTLSIEVPDWLGGGEFGFNFKMSSHISIPRFEYGGFPATGSMFIANEAGPELVGRIGSKTAVANNDQIITGIAAGVYNAMMAAQEDSKESGGGTARIVVQIGDRAVGEAAVEYINGRIRQTGTNPIYN